MEGGGVSALLFRRLSSWRFMSGMSLSAAGNTVQRVSSVFCFLTIFLSGVSRWFWRLGDGFGFFVHSSFHYVIVGVLGSDVSSVVEVQVQDLL